MGSMSTTTFAAESVDLSPIVYILRSALCRLCTDFGAFMRFAVHRWAAR